MTQRANDFLKALLAGITLFAASAPAQSAADLNISPKRLVFSGATRSATVYVFNRGDEPATYSIELVGRVMQPDGQIVAVADVAPDSAAATAAARLKDAKPVLSFSPRRVTLAPGQSQVIRVRVLAPAELPAGEYRSHLTVTTLPPEDTGLTAEQAAEVGEGQVAVRVVSLLSLSIPLIVRKDATAGTAGIESLAVLAGTEGAADAPPASVGFDLTRQGEGSVFGNLEVTLTKAGAQPEVVGAIKGIAVYAEIGRRHVQLPLTRKPARGERLAIRFVDDDATPGKTLATASLDVQ